MTLIPSDDEDGPLAMLVERAGPKKKRIIQIADSSDESCDEEKDQIAEHLERSTDGISDLPKEKSGTQLNAVQDDLDLSDSDIENSKNTSVTANEQSILRRKSRLQIVDSSDDESDNECTPRDHKKTETQSAACNGDATGNCLTTASSESKLDERNAVTVNSSEVGENSMVDRSSPVKSRDQGTTFYASVTPGAEDKLTNSVDANSSDDDSDSEKALFDHQKCSDDVMGDSKDDDASEQSSSDSDADSSDDDTPPVRIFRNKDAAASGYRNIDADDISDDEGPSVSRIPRKPHPRAASQHLDITSETQRLIRESAINLPYHIPEAKKVSDFLKRPTVEFDTQASQRDRTPKSSPSKVDAAAVDAGTDSGVSLTEEQCTPEKSGDSVTQETLSRRAKLLAERGVKIPELNTPKEMPSLLGSKSDFIELDDDENHDSPQSSGVVNFMQRFLKHSAQRCSNNKKKVQFTIVRKEERADGTGSELVPDVVVASESVEQSSKEHLFSSCGGNYHRLREKLNQKMKERRSKERIKKEELQRLDNEEIGGDADDEEEEDFDEDWTDEEDAEDDENAEVVQKKAGVISDEEEDDDEDEPTQPILPDHVDADVSSNGSRASKISHTTLRSEASFPQLTSQSSFLLFDDSVKRANSNSKDLADQSYEPLYGSVIPPNQPELSDISDSSKPTKFNFDEDSIFCAPRSPQDSLINASQSRTDFDSQFIDSDGFIKETKPNKTIGSFLPPGAEDDNANDCNMSQLLELCSGKFQETAGSPLNASADDGELPGNESLGFQIEPDQLKDQISNQFSDEEREDESDDDEGLVIVRRKHQVQEKMTRNFLDQEAELSGDDVGSDEDDDENGGDFYEEDEINEILPKEEVIHRQVNKVHLKQLLDDDQKDIELLQEAFVEDAVEMRRNRKFRWKNIDSSMTQDMFDSDDDDDKNDNAGADGLDSIENEESQWRRLRLEREEFIDSQSQQIGQEDEEDSQLLQMGRTAIVRSRVLSEINEQSRDRTPTLKRSTSFNQPKLPSKGSFLMRKPELLSKFANYKELKNIKGAVNSDKMVFKVVSPKKLKRKSKSAEVKIAKKLRIDEDSNSVFDLFDA